MGLSSGTNVQLMFLLTLNAQPNNGFMKVRQGKLFGFALMYMFKKPDLTHTHFISEYTEPKPPGIYDMIETLLPKAGFDETIGRGRLLELWAKRQTPRREGWLAFHNIKSEVDTSMVDSLKEGVEGPVEVVDSEMDTTA
jgi:hypothetical protein